MNTAKHQTWFQKNRLLWGGILIVIFALLRIAQTTMWLRQFGSQNIQNSLAFFLFLLFWIVVMSVGLIAGGIVWLTGTSWRQMGWSRQGLPRAAVKGLLGFVLLYVNVVIWAMLQGNTEPPEILTFSLSRIVLTAVFAFGLAAWVEENLYRGYWQPLLAEKMNIWLAIVVQAAVFSAAHVGYTWRLPDFGMLFTGGLILGWLRGRENSLIAPFLAHGLFWMMAAFIVVR